MNCRHDVKIALKHYRYLKAFCENAVDSMDWYIADYQISSQIRAITQSRMDTLTLMAHMVKALDTYGALCRMDGNERPYNVIVRKYVDPAGGSDGRGRPFTNEQLADMFDCSVETIYRDIRDGYDRISILFFGINGLKSEKQSTS